MKSGTEITKSQKSFEITEDKGIMLLKELQYLPQYQRIHVRAKVIHVGKDFELRNGGTVQETIIADATGHVIPNIWEITSESLRKGAVMR